MRLSSWGRDSLTRCCMSHSTFLIWIVLGEVMKPTFVFCFFYEFHMLKTVIVDNSMTEWSAVSQSAPYTSVSNKLCKALTGDWRCNKKRSTSTLVWCSSLVLADSSVLSWSFWPKRRRRTAKEKVTIHQCMDMGVNQVDLTLKPFEPFVCCDPCGWSQEYPVSSEK